MIRLLRLRRIERDREWAFELRKSELPIVFHARRHNRAPVQLHALAALDGVDPQALDRPLGPAFVFGCACSIFLRVLVCEVAGCAEAEFATAMGLECLIAAVEEGED